MSNILTDIAVLAKAGYSPADVKEILTMQKAEPEKKPDEPAAIPAKEQRQPEQEKDKEPEKPDASKEKPEEPEKDAKQEEIDQLKEQIKKLEEANASKDVSGNKDNKQMDNFIDLVKSYM